MLFAWHNSGILLFQKVEKQISTIAEKQHKKKNEAFYFTDLEIPLSLTAQTETVWSIFLTDLPL